ncbi:MAG: histidine phosphatase family protein [Hyphomonadaceae bacterium]
MRRVWLIRHAEPTAGWGEAADPGLSVRGQTQAAACAAAMQNVGVFNIISSPMRRCRETAAPLAALQALGLTIDPRVSEVAAPSGTEDRAGWLRRTFPWRGDVAPTIWPQLSPELWAWRANVLSAFADLDGDVAVFTHFIAINTIAGAALGRPETIVCRPAHASITELAIEGGALRLIAHGAQMQGDDVR